MAKDLGHGVRVGDEAWDEVDRLGAAFLFSPEAVRGLTDLHQRLEQTRLALLGARESRQAEYDAGTLPSYIDDHAEAQGDWQVAPIPEDLQERRVEITGPVGSAKMVINMLNPGPDGIPADTAMLDFEDSMKPEWDQVLQGVMNVMGAARGDLKFETPKKTYQLKEGKRAKVMVRLRGLHLTESNVTVGGEPMSASLFDMLMVATHSARIFLRQGLTPKFYVPKCEHFLEARWWNEAFAATEKWLGLKRGTLRATFLIETLPAAFQMEEILYEFRERACGLNGGRWDKIFSDIKVLKEHEDRILADRSAIDMKRPWMDNYAKRLIKICHKHGAFAMGGMSAFTPGREPEVREAQTKKVLEDKGREAQIGHDGCWVSHPFFIGPARAQFTKKNQLDVRLEDFPARPDLLPQSEGPKTLQGLRTNIRVGMAYLHGWNEGLGCVAFDNLMEDLATLEISRAQVWQWLHHGVSLDDGTKVTADLIKILFDEECARILEEIRPEVGNRFEDYKRDWVQARNEACELFLQEELSSFLTMASPQPHRKET